MKIRIDIDALAESHFSHEDPAFQDDEETEEYKVYKDLYDLFCQNLKHEVDTLMWAIIDGQNDPRTFAELFAEEAADYLQEKIEEWKE